jgi:hypothetical protein
MTHLLQYIVRAGDALSQLANVLILMSDNPNESVSGRAYRQGGASNQPRGFWWCLFLTINFLFWWQDNHCRSAYYADVARAQRLLRAHTSRI